MSKIKIVGHASGSGVLTIAAPNTNTDRTITIPDVTGTLLDSGSDLPAAQLTGTVADARISALTASKLTGALPAISAANLTSIPAGNLTGTVADARISALTASKLTGALPAIDGSSLTGISSVGGATGVGFNDNVKAQFGTGNDLQIFHDGTDSYINDAGIGSLEIRTNGTFIGLMGNDGAENMGKFVQDGAVELYHNGVKKIETTSTGVSVTGDLSVSGSISGAGKVLQVVSTTSTTRFSTSSTSFTSVTGLNASITPSSTSSKILVIASVNVATSSGQDHRIRCIRGASTDVGGGSSGFSFFRHGDGEQVVAKVLVDLDTPANTSSNTYTIQVTGEGGNIYVNQTKWSSQYLSSSITLMEIGA